MYIWYVNPPCGSGDGDYSDIHPFQSLMSLTCSEFATLPQIPQNRVEPGWKVKTISNIWISGGASPVLGCWMPPSSPVESYSRRNLEKQLGRNNHTPTFLSLFGKPTLQLFSPKEHETWPWRKRLPSNPLKSRPALILPFPWKTEDYPFKQNENFRPNKTWLQTVVD